MSKTKFKISVSGETEAEFKQNLAAINASINGGSVNVTVVNKSENAEVETSETPKGRGRKAKEETKEDKKGSGFRMNDEIAAQREAEKAPKKEEKEEPAIDYAKEVKPLIIEIGDGDERLGLGTPALEDLFEKFGGIAHGKELKPEQYADFIEEANAVLAASKKKKSAKSLA